MISTPLRYPGGKSVMTAFLRRLFLANGFVKPVYAEPYAGGAGAAINLLVSDSVERILINDANLGIYSFWNAIVKENDKFCDWVNNQPVTLEAWNYWHRFFKEAHHSSFELGFATFFLSRTNRSGILNAGPIGGNSVEKQFNAKYKLDCRFNRESLSGKIHRIGQFVDRIEVTQLDALAFLHSVTKRENLFVYLDPPYYEQGNSLYMNYYSPDDHRELAKFLSENRQMRWIMSYDDVDTIHDIYQSFNSHSFLLNYSAREARIGKEVLIYNSAIVMPEDMTIINNKG